MEEINKELQGTLDSLIVNYGQDFLNFLNRPDTGELTELKGTKKEIYLLFAFLLKPEGFNIYSDKEIQKIKDDIASKFTKKVLDLNRRIDALEIETYAPRCNECKRKANNASSFHLKSGHSFCSLSCFVEYMERKLKQNKG